MNEKETEFMRKAITLAKKGEGKILPNPRVGAVVVKNGKIVGKGFHEFFGGKHAEKIALENAGKKARGATLFLTLEPCMHFGKQPPCGPEVVHAGIKEVFIASTDPNQKGKGVKFLNENRVKVHTGLLGKEAIEINKEFFRFVKTKNPFVTLKVAASLDGKITFGDGKRKKISGPESFEKVLELRKNTQAIIVGKNTVFKDNPRLSTRSKGFSPLRIVLCSDARLPLNSNVFSREAKTLVVCTKKARKKDMQKILEKGVGVLVAKEKNGKVDLKQLMEELGQAQIASVLVEAGQEMCTSFLEEGLFDEFILIVSPKKIGKGKDLVKDWNLLKKLRLKKLEKVGKDIWAVFGKTGQKQIQIQTT